jgi:purine-cytosine permease-like protein
MNILTVVTGALATTLFGLNFIPACFAIIAGIMLGTVFMALRAAQGPQLGAPQMVLTRGPLGFPGSILVIGAVILMYWASSLRTWCWAASPSIPRCPASSVNTGVAPVFWGTCWATALGSIVPMILGAMIGLIVGYGDVVAGFAHASGGIAQELYTGPISKMLGGAGISWIVCLIVISPAYYFVSRSWAKTVTPAYAAE